MSSSPPPQCTPAKQASIQSSLEPSYKYPVFESLTYNFFEAESKATPFLIEISPYGRSSA